MNIEEEKKKIRKKMNENKEKEKTERKRVPSEIHCPSLHENEMTASIPFSCSSLSVSSAIASASNCEGPVSKKRMPAPLEKRDSEFSVLFSALLFLSLPSSSPPLLSSFFFLSSSFSPLPLSSLLLLLLLLSSLFSLPISLHTLP